MKRIARIGVVALVIVFCIANWVEADEKLLGNTARGAAKGAIIGGIAGDAGKGAAAGAVGGALFGGMERRPGPETTMS